MTTSRLCAALMGALLCSLAHAEPKLFPTDLLAPRQADATVTLEGARSSGDVRANGYGLNGSLDGYASTLSASARYGITYALMLGAGLDAGTTHSAAKFNGLRLDSHAEGMQAANLFARYAVMPESRGNPYALTTDVSVSHRYNPQGSTSYNVYSVNGNFSARTTDLVRTYAGLGVSVPSKGYASREASARAGGWMLVNPGVTASLELAAIRRVASSVLSSANTTEATVAGIWDLAPHTNLRAALTMGRTTGATTTQGDSLSIRPSQAQRLGVTLYHQY